MTTEFAPEEWYGHGFASGVFLGDQGDKILDLSSLEAQRDIAAYFHACPIRREVSREYGTDWTRRRYLMCNFWYGWIVGRAKVLKPDLASDLTAMVERHDPVGKFEPGAVPESYLDEMGPTSRIPGYALPRVLIRAIDIVKPESQESKQDRFLRVAGFLDQAIAESNTGNELLAIFSEKLVEAKIVKPLHILDHILPYGLFEEQGGRYYLYKMGNALRHRAPTIWRAYRHLSLETMELEGIFDSFGYGDCGVMLLRYINGLFDKPKKERKRLLPNLNAVVLGALISHGLAENLVKKVVVDYLPFSKDVRGFESEMTKTKGNLKIVIAKFEKAFGRQLLRRVDLSLKDK
jgi:hypothetical protein